jgi:hypothetical protein
VQNPPTLTPTKPLNPTNPPTPSTPSTPSTPTTTTEPAVIQTATLTTVQNFDPNNDSEKLYKVKLKN